MDKFFLTKSHKLLMSLALSSGTDTYLPSTFEHIVRMCENMKFKKFYQIYLKIKRYILAILISLQLAHTRLHRSPFTKIYTNLTHSTSAT